MRLEDVEAAAQAKLDRARDLITQYEDTITELSQDSSSLTASAQALRDDNSALSASLETARAEAEHLQAPALILCPPSKCARLGAGFQRSCPCNGHLRPRPCQCLGGVSLSSSDRKLHLPSGSAGAVVLCRRPVHALSHR